MTELPSPCALQNLPVVFDWRCSFVNSTYSGEGCEWIVVNGIFSSQNDVIQLQRKRVIPGQ